MRSHLLFLLFALTTTLSAQSFDRSSRKYRDKFSFEAPSGEKIIRTWYHYVVSLHPNGKYIVRVFYPETGQLTEYITFSDQKLSTKDGPYQHWFDDGELHEKGTYTNGQRTDHWYGSEGEGSYAQGEREGHWTLWDLQRSTLTGPYAHGLRTGTWSRRDSTGQETEVLNYVRDTLHGKCLEFGPLGTPPIQRIYAKGKVIEGPAPADRRMREPMMASCMVLDPSGLHSRECTTGELHKYIGKEIRFPRRSMMLGITGRAIMQFTVDRSGKVTEIVAKSGVCEEIEEECIRVLTNAPPWIPGTMEGVPVKCRYSLPIKFSLR